MSAERIATTWAVFHPDGRQFVTTDPRVAAASIRNSAVLPILEELPSTQQYGNPIPKGVEASLLDRARTEHLRHLMSVHGVGPLVGATLPFLSHVRPAE